jgi:SAM-dependent methyltransferase
MSHDRSDVSASGYVLGHSPLEIGRLKTQARFIDPITRHFFLQAGVSEGMRVLDVGTGAGDVAFLVARIVGDLGEVVAVDRVPAALDTARGRASGHAMTNVHFLEGDPAEMRLDSPFDAVVGRYVLQFQPDPSSMLRGIARHVRPGGIVAFHEIDWSGLGSFPAAPVYDQCCAWGIETLRAHGTETRMGAKLHSAFVGAGLPSPTMCLEALVGGGANIEPLLQLIAGLMSTLLPQMERLGVATAADVEIDTLVERLRNDAIAHSSVLFGHYQIGAWARL